VSPTKIDSLFEQIEPGVLSKIAKSLTIDLKLVKATFSSIARPDTLVLPAKDCGGVPG
jgi:hypothetical protein